VLAGVQRLVFSSALVNRPSTPLLLAGEAFCEQASETGSLSARG
jgi:hypothetical protein